MPLYPNERGEYPPVRTQARSSGEDKPAGRRGSRPYPELTGWLPDGTQSVVGIGKPADWKSAIQQVGNLRYGDEPTGAKQWSSFTGSVMMSGMTEPDEIKVLIINEEGQYLAGTGTHWEFTDERARARVFDYIGDHVADQIQLVRNAYGKAWVAVRLDPREAYEYCDRCGSRMVAMRSFFNGREFLCKACHEVDMSPAPSAAHPLPAKP
jgi:hypothetical protein